MMRIGSPVIERAVLALLLLIVSGIAGEVRGQCILANPSFELPGTEGAVFGGWNQFGIVGEAGEASHGARAARVRGPDSGAWDVSAYWQRLDSEPGEQWEVTGHVRHPAERPLVGMNVALVNVEWRDSGGQLIDYDSFEVADSGTPTDAWIEFDLLSDPAPVGTVAIHFLVGVLQSPSDPTPDVYYDEVTIYSTGPPSIDELQWVDFPGGRSVDFGGRSWRVKGPGYYGPGPNVFCDDSECVWVDTEGKLHLTLADRGGTWKSTEVALEEALGYGDYVLTTEGRLDRIDPHAVFGIFLWQYGPCWDEAYLWWNPYNEVDIEYSRWGDPGSDIGQFVAQPFDYPGNIERFDAVFGEEEVTSHAIRWSADRVDFRVWRGGPEDESPANLIHSWTYSGPHIPRPDQPRVHLNLWKLPDVFPSTDQEVVLRDFRFIPEHVPADVGPRPGAGRASSIRRLELVRPSPFQVGTTIRFGLLHGEVVDLGVFSLEGRRVRTLYRGFLEAGRHGADWDGRDDAGRPVSTGTYWIRLAGNGFAEALRVIRLR
ncbi:MAG: hypothetical protein GF346_06265 [Candidatus Eisenbacteria bacterium]|nr:hypothetical protein [Candidatus Latescibacterota bacterium]MBD3302030.1 hypothetical protein [Candidatus Eisenbacteria bacterium]